MLNFRSFILLFASLSLGVSASVVSTSLVIANKQLNPDGYPRNTTLASGTFPGPIIRANKGDDLKIEVTDQLTDDSLDLVTSIHWHGISQNHTNYADGPTDVTQCPIVPNESFTYEFSVQDQAGTFWYHSHYKAQYCDGLRGALIIEDPNDPQKYLYDVDNDDTVITLADWYHYVSPIAPAVPPFNSTLINGLGRYPGGPNSSLAVVNVQQGKRYRFRLISISCHPSFIFSIDNHTMAVIEVDGTAAQPLLIDSLEIFAGQRYSIVVNASLPVDNYWIRSLPDTTGRNYSDLNNLAILRYAGASIENPTSDPTVNIPVSKTPLVETNLHPLVPSSVPGNPTPGGADININLDVTLSTDGTSFLVNGESFTPPTVPVLLQILSGVKNASDLLPAGSIYGLDRNKSVELTIPAGVAGGPHPVHLHGHSFYVVRSANSTTYNYDNPIVRDVVSIGSSGDEVTIRFFTDNPGPWFFHCHIDWHLRDGFAVVFAEDVPDVPSQVIPTAAWDQLCPTYNKFVNQTSS